MICLASKAGETITVTVTPEPVITLIAVGKLWDSTRPPTSGQLLDLDFILDSSTLG